MRISEGFVNISVSELANMLVAVSEDLELQKEISKTSNKMEQFCNALGYGDEAPTDLPDEEDFRYEIVGTYIDYITDEDTEDLEDDDIPF